MRLNQKKILSLFFFFFLEIVGGKLTRFLETGLPLGDLEQDLETFHERLYNIRLRDRENKLNQ